MRDNIEIVTATIIIYAVQTRLWVAQVPSRTERKMLREPLFSSRTFSDRPIPSVVCLARRSASSVNTRREIGQAHLCDKCAARIRDRRYRSSYPSFADTRSVINWRRKQDLCCTSRSRDKSLRSRSC